jgi:hypothetical protein
MGDTCHGGWCVPTAVLPTWYRDADGDGFGDPWDAMCTAVPPADYVDNPDDCCDERGDVFPGQPAFFTTSYHCGMLPVELWDYDCSGTVDVQFPDCQTCSAGTVGDCWWRSGWGSPTEPCPAVPPCGAWEEYSYCRFDLGSCRIVAGVVEQQGCR